MGYGRFTIVIELDEAHPAAIAVAGEIQAVLDHMEDRFVDDANEWNGREVTIAGPERIDSLKQQRADRVRREQLRQAERDAEKVAEEEKKNAVSNANHEAQTQ